MKAPHSPAKRSSTTRKRTPGSKGKKRKTTKRKSADGGEASEAKPSPKLGEKEEYSARIPRARQVFAMFLQNQNHPNPAKKFPTNAEIGKALQPDKPLGTAAVRAILDMMRDDLGMPVDYIEEREGHGFTEPVAGFPLDAISEEQAYYLIQSVQMLGGASALADVCGHPDGGEAGLLGDLLCAEPRL